MHSSDKQQLNRSLRPLSARKTRREEDHVFGDVFLQLFVNGLRATNETIRGHAVTEFDET
jgi:hypothetical protein